MLEYMKTILEKVSFDKHLFEKEYEKAKIKLSKQEFEELEAWVMHKFGKKVILANGRLMLAQSA